MPGSHLVTIQPMVMFITIPGCWTIGDWIKYKMSVEQHGCLNDCKGSLNGPLVDLETV